MPISRNRGRAPVPEALAKKALTKKKVPIPTAEQESGPGRWFLYLIRCGRGHLYTGITTDVERRLREHAESPRGARFLRGRGPLTLAYATEVGSRVEALRLEYRVKQLRRVQKEALVQGRIDLTALAKA